MALGNENVSVGMIQCLTDNKQVTNTASSDQRQTLMTDSPWRSQNNPPFTQLGSQAVSSSSRLVLDLLKKIRAQWGKSWVCNIDLLLLFLLIESCFFSSSNFTEISRVTPEKKTKTTNVSCSGWFRGGTLTNIPQTTNVSETSYCGWCSREWMFVFLDWDTWRDQWKVFDRSLFLSKDVKGEDLLFLSHAK